MHAREWSTRVQACAEEKFTVTHVQRWNPAANGVMRTGDTPETVRMRNDRASCANRSIFIFPWRSNRAAGTDRSARGIQSIDRIDHSSTFIDHRSSADQAATLARSITRCWLRYGNHFRGLCHAASFSRFVIPIKPVKILRPRLREDASRSRGTDFSRRWRSSSGSPDQEFSGIEPGKKRSRWSETANDAFGKISNRLLSRREHVRRGI